MKKRYLITGSTGFIGSHLLDALLEQGVPESSIRLAVRNKKKIHRKGTFQIIEGDLRNAHVAIKAIEGVDTIYHLAAVSGFGGSTLQAYREGNVLPTKNLLSAIGKKHIHKFVFFSTVAVYGLPSTVGDICNWDESHPQKFSEMYGQSKVEAEKEIYISHNKYGIPFTILRPASVYGPRDFGQLYGVYKAIAGNYFFIIGNGKNKMDFIFVDDVIAGAIQAEHSKKEASDYILASGNPTEFSTLATHVAQSIGKNDAFLFLPKILIYPVSILVEQAGNIVGKQFPLFPSRVNILTSSYYYDISKAKKELRFSPTTSFAQGTNITGRWYSSHGHISL